MEFPPAAVKKKHRFDGAGIDAAGRGVDSGEVGKYRVLRRIASGGMAEVYLCRLSESRGSGSGFALK